MLFQPINGTLITRDQDAVEYMELIADMEEVELFSVESIRTLKQNKKMWPLLTDISKQVTWLGAKHDPETWKVIIVSAWRSQVFVQGIGGTLVVIPPKTSRLSKKSFSELIESIYSFGSGEGVKWSDPALQAYSDYREAA